MMSLQFRNRFPARCSKRLARPGRRSSFHSRPRGVEVLEDRQLLATFAVTSLGDTGVGSLRWAIMASNAVPGPDTIDFEVAGTIRVGRASLPAITDPVDIDGSTAPTFAGAPVVTVDFHGTRGLQFNPGADGSVLRSLSLVRASNAGVTLNASGVTVQGNDIGLLSDGVTAAGNRGDGVQINASSRNDLIGRSDPVTGVSYFNASGVGIQPVSGWQGIRNADTSGQYLITGTSGSDGLLYEGPISGVGGTSVAVDVPGATTSSVYGPDIVDGDVLRLVGSYKNGAGIVNGFLFQGTTADLGNAGHYRTIDYPGAIYTYVHSTMGDLAVGNADGPEGNAPLGTGHAFLYGVSQGAILANIVFPGSLTTTAYGIWYNGGTSYTIAGGYSTAANPNQAGAFGYLVDYDALTGQFSNWTSFSEQSPLVGPGGVTHFEGISGVEKGVYTLSADSAQIGSNGVQGSLVTVRRNTDGSFGPAEWVDLSFPGVGPVTANSVAGNQVVGIVPDGVNTFSFQASVNVGFQLSNVISGNGGNGIGIYGAADNQIAMNDIGTDASGTVARGNAKNGILVTGGAAGNLIGGQATGGNDPTANVIVRPPQGNTISGNRQDGVLITGGATGNLLSGNFIGTSASGITPLGNRQDGVAIVGADGNSLIGCTFQQDPFVFYNVISGNGGNGLRVTNSNNTTVQANFMGVGANNATLLPNGGDGLLVSGSSTNTQVGGVIPLGNVIAGNDRNGIEVRDRASGFISFNTFAGLFAFAGAAPNRLDGILITSSGGNNTVRTSIVSGNLGNGIEIGGNATGVQVTETAVGTNTSIQTPLANGGDGILITGNAHGNAIGGFQPSIEPQVTVSSNAGYGIRITGKAHDNVVFHTNIGTNAQASGPLSNGLGGIYLGPGTSSNTIGGGKTPAFQDKILYNGGLGVTIQSSNGNTVVGDEILGNAGGGVAVTGGRNDLIRANSIEDNGLDGLDVSGLVTGTSVQANAITGNANNGVALTQAQQLTVGGPAPGVGNVITGNQNFGLYASGRSNGTLVQGNTIEANTTGDVNLSRSTGITFIP